jgi:acetyl esterase/lipase
MTVDPIDPEFADAVRDRIRVDLADIQSARAAGLARHDNYVKVAVSPDVEDHDVMIDGPTGLPLRVRVFAPRQATTRLRPALLWIQGGGHCMYGPDLDDAWCAGIALTHDCVVVSVEWRRSPESPFPAAIDDSYAALGWLFSSAPDLGVDTGRVVIGGASSGGGLAAGLALLTRDRGEYAIGHQLLVYPMLDDRNTTASSRRVTDPQLWNRATNLIAWGYYLGDARGTDQVSPYAAPARAVDLAGLPSASIFVGQADLFVDENVEYAQRLMNAGVLTNLYVYAGAPHGFFRLNTGASTTKRFYLDRDYVLGRVLATNPHSTV